MPRLHLWRRFFSLMIWPAILALAFTVTLGYWQFQHERRSHREMVEAKTWNQVRLSAQSLQLAIAPVVSSAQFLAGILESNRLRTSALSGHLNNLEKRFPMLETIIIRDASGQILARAGDPSFRQLIPMAPNAAEPDVIWFKNRLGFSLSFQQPGGRGAGHIEVLLGLMPLQEILAKSASELAHSRFYLFEPTGRLALSGDRNAMFMPESGDLPSFAPLLKSRSGEFRYELPAKGAEPGGTFQAAFQPVGRTGWTLLLAAPNQFEGARYLARDRYLLLTLFLALWAALFLESLLRQQLRRPSIAQIGRELLLAFESKMQKERVLSRKEQAQLEAFARSFEQVTEKYEQKYHVSLFSASEQIAQEQESLQAFQQTLAAREEEVQLLASALAASHEEIDRLRDGDRQEESALLRRQIQNLESIIEALDYGVLLSNSRHQVIFSNSAAEMLLGLDAVTLEQPLGRIAESIELMGLEGETIPLDDWPMVKGLKGTTYSGLELLCRTRHGVSHLIFNGSPLRGAEGQILWAVSVFRPVGTAVTITPQGRG